MQPATYVSPVALPNAVRVPINLLYVWAIAAVAALGGLLFGYDWVVIGGAKPFYEAAFHLTRESTIGWANSCALLGCLAGSLVAGFTCERFGRRPVLLASAVLFAVSSLLTGWASNFDRFVLWRIAGGVAIGVASNASPMYIAEISPAAWRGRLVSLNQLALVVGILLAQIVNWKIARPVPDHATLEMMAQSWNGMVGWRWMFSAVAVPAAAFFFAALFIPESPRWQALHDRVAPARRTLTRIGGAEYAEDELAAVLQARGVVQARSSYGALLAPGLRRVLLIGVGLAVLQQWSGINILFNYAQEVYRSAGFGVSDVLFNIVITGTINLVATVLAMLFVDRLGRRPLMIGGCVGVGLAHVSAAYAYHAHLPSHLILTLTLCAIALYAMSLAPITWVLISEIFPNQVRGSAISVTVSALWIASFVLTYTFPIINRKVGTSGAFLGYGLVCFAGAAFVKVFLRETRNKTLEEISE